MSASAVVLLAVLSASMASLAAARLPGYGLQDGWRPIVGYPRPRRPSAGLHQPQPLPSQRLEVYHPPPQPPVPIVRWSFPENILVQLPPLHQANRLRQQPPRHQPQHHQHHQLQHQAQHHGYQVTEVTNSWPDELRISSVPKIPISTTAASPFQTAPTALASSRLPPSQPPPPAEPFLPTPVKPAATAAATLVDDVAYIYNEVAYHNRLQDPNGDRYRNRYSSPRPVDETDSGLLSFAQRPKYKTKYNAIVEADEELLKQKVKGVQDVHEVPPTVFISTTRPRMKYKYQPQPSTVPVVPAVTEPSEYDSFTLRTRRPVEAVQHFAPTIFVQPEEPFRPSYSVVEAPSTQFFEEERATTTTPRPRLKQRRRRPRPQTTPSTEPPTEFYTEPQTELQFLEPLTEPTQVAVHQEVTHQEATEAPTTTLPTEPPTQSEELPVESTTSALSRLTANRYSSRYKQTPGGHQQQTESEAGVATTSTPTTPSTTTKKTRQRPLRVESQRPRFSVKDYRQRLSTSSSSSTTTTSTTPSPSTSSQTPYRTRFTPRPRGTFSRFRSTTASSASAESSTAASSTPQSPRRPLFPSLKKATSTTTTTTTSSAKASSSTSTTAHPPTTTPPSSEDSKPNGADEEEEEGEESNPEPARRVSELTSAIAHHNSAIFKGVPSNSRRVPNYFTIATEDPILPIQAVFTNLEYAN